jgi:hypothetical protein
LNPGNWWRIQLFPFWKQLPLTATLSILETVRHEGSRSVKRNLEYDNYRRRQDREFISDFDREIKRIHGKPKQESNDE